MMLSAISDPEAIGKLRAYIEARSIPEPNSGCWLWLLSVGSHGYGQGSVTWFNGKRVDVAHRLSYYAFKGDIPTKYEIDHKCRCRSCVNPDHLEAVPKRVNVRRQFGLMSEDFTRCAYGHDEYYRAANGKMSCNACDRAGYARSRVMQKQQEAA